MNQIETENDQQQPDYWQKKFVEAMLQPPTIQSSKIHFASRLALERGLLPSGGKFGLIKEFAGIRPHFQNEGKQPKTLDEIDFEEIARNSEITPDRLKIVAELMVETDIHIIF